MKAAQFTAPGQIDLVDVPEPEGEDVIVRMDKVTICGSDLHFLDDSPAEKYPFLPGQSGHECVGVVEEANGADVQRGDRMLVIPPDFNAFAEYLMVPSHRLIALPEGLGTELGVLGQQLGTVIFCCKKLTNVLGKVVVVNIGGG